MLALHMMEFDVQTGCFITHIYRFQPSTEEAEMYKNYKGDKESLPKTDQFMIKV